MRARWIGWLVTAVVCLAALFTLDPALFGVSTYEPFAQLIALRGAVALGVLGLAAGLLLCALMVLHRGERRPVRLVIASVVLVAVAITHAVITLSRGTARPEALPSAKPPGAIDVLSFNTWDGATGSSDIAALIDRFAPDVVALPETTMSSANAIATQTNSAYAVFMGLGNPGGSAPTALLVATSLGEYERIDGPDIDYGMVGAQSVDGSGPVLYAVHAVSPVGERMPVWRADLALLTDICDTTPGIIMAGDFNATLDHEPMRATRCVDGAIDSGGVGTWPTSAPALLGASIDHVLADPDRWTPVASTVADRPNSDHRAVIVRLQPAS